MTDRRFLALLEEAGWIAAAADEGDFSGGPRLQEIGRRLAADPRSGLGAWSLVRLGEDIVVAGLTAKVRGARRKVASERSEGGGAPPDPSRGERRRRRGLSEFQAGQAVNPGPGSPLVEGLAEGGAPG